MHPLSILRRLLLGLLLGCLPLSAAALSCGDNVSGHVVLTADLHCEDGWTALYVDTAETTIDLNGHVLSGGRGLVGIMVHAAGSVRVQGPGAIIGFWAGINAASGHKLTVDGVSFKDLGTGVIVTNAASARVQASSFTMIEATAITISDGGYGDWSFPAYHVVENNQFSEVNYGVQICGLRTDGSRVRNNAFSHIGWAAIELSEGASKATIENNRISDAAEFGIVLRATRDVMVRDNTLQQGTVAIWLDPQLTGACNSMGASAEVTGSRIEGNQTSGHVVAVSLGNESGGKARVSGNLIRSNKLVEAGTGIRFTANAHFNDGRGNVIDAVEPVIDLGAGNRW